MRRHPLNSLGEVLPLVLLVMLPSPIKASFGCTISLFGDVNTFSQTLAKPEYSFCLFNVTLPLSALIFNRLVSTVSILRELPYPHYFKLSSSPIPPPAKCELYHYPDFTDEEEQSPFS